MRLELQQTPASPSVLYSPVVRRTPAPFHGDVSEDIDDLIQQYERVARYNGWTPEQCIQNVYFSPQATARRWFENHEATINSWDLLKDELRGTFATQRRREHAEQQLQARVIGPNENLVSFVEDVLRLSKRNDPQGPEGKKLRILMRGVKESVFGGLLRDPPTTFVAFFWEAANIERALQARASHYRRLSGVASSALFSSSTEPNSSDIREVIRDVVREELRNMLPAASHPASISIAEAVREEVQRALRPEISASMAVPEERR